MLIAASLFAFSACEKEDDPVTPNTPDTPGQEDQSFEELIVGQWTVTASQESFQYSEGASWSDATDAVVGETFVFNADKTGWMYFEEEGSFTWTCNGSNIDIIEANELHMTGTITKTDNNHITLNNLEKPRYKATISLKRK